MGVANGRDRCHRKFCRPEILSIYFNAATTFPIQEAASSLDISGGTGPQYPLVPPPMSNSAVLRGKVFRCKSATEFPRKCGRCVKIERQNFLGKIVAATDFPRKFCRATKFPSDRISCDTGPSHTSRIRVQCSISGAVHVRILVHCTAV